MAREDRERSFEKALARHLRADNRGAAGRAAQPGCAEAETLAAYHERELPPREMTFWKEHISSCSRCQEIVANLDATDAVPVVAQHKNETAVPVHTGDKAPVHEISKSPRPRRWLWTAPAGAIAAALLVWIVLQEKPHQMELAKNERPRVSLSPTAPRSEVATTPSEPAATGDREKAALPRTYYPGGAPRRMAKPTIPRVPSAKPLPKDLRDDHALDTFASARPSTLDEQQAQGAISNQLQERSKPSESAPMPAPSAMSQTVIVNAEAVPVTPPPPQPAAPQKLAKAKAAAASPDQQSRPRQQVQDIGGMSRSRFSDGPVVLLANSKIPSTVATPNEKVSWRVGREGTIERSEDAGATWSRQTSGIVNDLVAGSAPSDKVCWVVGQLGTILRTTDAGTTWTKVHSPVNEDILSVFAVNDQQATISTAHGSYQTLDAGVTWNKLAPE
jgi:Photosynthesis system II assembly factor YCF48